VSAWIPGGHKRNGVAGTLLRAEAASKEQAGRRKRG
jgi:hypothetical protein